VLWEYDGDVKMITCADLWEMWRQALLSEGLKHIKWAEAGPAIPAGRSLVFYDYAGELRRRFPDVAV
jgi:hypothetical protein